MIWNQDLLYQIINLWFKIRIYYIKSWTYDLKSRFIISNYKCMIWNKNLLYQINDVWYHITKLYLVNNEKKYKIKLNHFFYKRRPIPHRCILQCKFIWTTFSASNQKILERSSPKLDFLININEIEPGVLHLSVRLWLSHDWSPQLHTTQKAAKACV